MATTIPSRHQRKAATSSSAPADLEQALYDLGIEVTGGDDDEVKGRCPYHVFYLGKEDGDPSWSVNRSTGWHNCFSCPGQGSFITLVTDMLDCSNFEAARWVSNYGLNMEQIENLPDYDERRERKKSSAVIEESDLLQFIRPPAEALAIRSISAEAARHYGVLWEPKHRAWILPIRMPDGVLIGWQSKGEKRMRSAQDVVLNHPKRMAKSLTLFGADVFPIGEPAVVLESPLDPARLLTAGLEGGVSTFGDKFSDEQMRVLRDLTDEVVWATDNDAAGRQAARIFRDGDPKTRRPAYARRFKARFLDYGLLLDAKDIGEQDVEDIHILRAVRGAKHSLLADLGESDVQRDATRLPGAGRRANGPARVPARGDGTGNRKNTNGNRRSRGTGRRIR